MKDFLLKIWNWIVSIPKDKLLHDYAGELIALYTFAVVFLVGSYWCAFIVANAVAVLALLGKGLYDYLHPESQSVELADFAYGVFGILKTDVALLLIGLATVI